VKKKPKIEKRGLPADAPMWHTKPKKIKQKTK
jgi:hypothetical protein